MVKIESVQQLKLNFLDIWKDISEDDTQSLITLNNIATLENRIKPFCTEEYPLEHVMVIFHAYASVAYLSAELIVNAKIFLDYKKEKYILLARKEMEKSFCFSIVYSNIKELSRYPSFGIPIDNMIGYLENSDAINELKEYYANNVK
ncbi:MAG: hypothetical protein ACNI3C_12130 [Candidatus Marinarcus sp.]|uniref:hypothetical protein n=1 Tax=Candidatus Marinarcus sp. TaxID=3100987 RepID=UPI003AFFF41C